MNYFSNCTTLDEAKSLYKKLALVLHPDKGGNTASFQNMQNAFESFQPSFENEKYKGEFEDWRPSEYMEIIDQLMKIPSIIIEVAGSWIWIDGDTKPVKELIKAINLGESFKRGFSKSKSKWYFSPKSYKKKSSKVLSMDKIRNLYGSKRYDSVGLEMIGSN